MGKLNDMDNKHMKRKPFDFSVIPTCSTTCNRNFQSWKLD